MERTAAISILQDTIDTLAAVNIELISRSGEPADARRRMAAQLQEAMTNIRAAMGSLEEHVARTLPPS